MLSANELILVNRVTFNLQEYLRAREARLGVHGGTQRELLQLASRVAVPTPRNTFALVKRGSVFMAALKGNFTMKIV